jgi:hypothetical protein
MLKRLWLDYAVSILLAVAVVCAVAWLTDLHAYVPSARPSAHRCLVPE